MTNTTNLRFGIKTAPQFTTYEQMLRVWLEAEGCELIRLMWTETAPDFDGKYYQLKKAYCEPKPIQKPYPPFVIGGGGEKLTLRVVARYANIWNFAGGTVEDFRHKNVILDNHCAAIERDPPTIERSIQLLINPDDLSSSRDALRSFIAAA